MTARDLGIDTTCSKRRRIPTFRKRLQHGLVRASRIAGLRKLNQGVRQLVYAGARPQMTWGHQAKGLSPSTLRTMKVALAKATGARSSGGCTTTAVALCDAAQKDPQ
eukprot:5155796-Heterocapsa_arctica.AAC.1